MLMACAKCGRIHEKNLLCKKSNKAKEKTNAVKFRNTQAWQKKRAEIRERDFQMCQACLLGLGTIKGRQYNYDNLEVHHIIPIEQEENLKLDNDNLVTLCAEHHEEAESGIISRDTLIAVIKKTPPYTSAYLSKQLATPRGHCGEENIPNGEKI